MNTVIEWVKQAKSEIENLSPDQVEQELASGQAVLIDVRDAEERVAGTIPSALHISRGTLEFAADPSSPMYKSELQPNTRTILHCAGGGRSALAVKTLQALGYRNVAHLEGGFKAWIDANKPVV